MTFEEVQSAHVKFCKTMCASFNEKPSPGWCGQAFMNMMNGHQGQGKCPWQDEEILRHTGGKR